MPASEQITLEIDERPAVQAAGRANAAVEGHEKVVTKVMDGAGKQWEVYGEKVIRVSDKSRSSVDRLVKSMEQQAAVFGKTGVEKLIAQRDQLISKWGQEQRAVESITKAYAKMIEEQRNESSGGSQWGERIKSAIENPLQAVGNMATGLFEKLGPVGVGIGVIATTLTAVAVAGVEAARGLAEYGIGIRDVGLRTGLSSKEVGQFSFAAKAAGSDVSVFERMMRGLTVAVEDQSSAGDKARGWLTKFGVDLRGVRDGTVSTSEVFRQISEGLEKLPPGFERGAAMMALFKRAGIESIPVMLELAKNLAIAKDEGFGPNDADVQKYIEMNVQLAIMDAHFAQLKRSLEEKFVVSLEFVGNAVEWFLSGKDSRDGHKDLNPRQKDEAAKLYDDIKLANSPAGQTYSTGLDPMQKLEQQRMNALKGLRPSDALNAAPGSIAASRIAEAAMYQQQSDAMRAAGGPDAIAKAAANRQGGDSAVASYDQQQGLAGQIKREQAILAKMPKPEAGLSTAKEVADYSAEEKKIKGLQAQEAAGKTVAEAEKRDLQQLTEWRHAAAEFQQKDDERELSVIGKIYYQRDLILKQAAGLKNKPSQDELTMVGYDAEDASNAILTKGYNEYLNKPRDLSWAVPGIESDTRDREARDAQQKKDAEAASQIASTQYDSQKDSLNRNANNALKISQASGATGMDAIRDSYQIRIGLATQLAEIAAVRIAKESDHDKQQELFALAQKDLQKEMSEAAEESLLKQLELQKQQMNVIKQDTEHLWNTLLTKPGQFGKQLADTVHSAVIKPIADGMSTVTARVLKPVIYGADGDGGIAGTMKGMFGGAKQDPMKTATDMNTAVTAQNSAALSMLTAILAGAMGMSAPAMASAPGGMGGVSAPAISVSAPSISAPSISNLFRAPSSGGGIMPMLFGSSPSPQAPRSTSYGAPSSSSSGFIPMLFGHGSAPPSPSSIQSGPSSGGFSQSSQAQGSGDDDDDFGSSDGSSSGATRAFAQPGASPLARLFGGGGSGGGNSPSPMGGLFGGLFGGGSGGSGGGGNSGSQSGSGSMAGNFSGMFKGFKGNLGGFTHSDVVSGDADSPGGQFHDTGGGINGVNGMAGAALMGGGMMAAQAGLLGKNRGTGTGIAEGAAGGAAIGLEMGGPIGMGIGAAVGGMIGVGEMLAGDVSPETKAKQLCKSIYGISIDNGMATQIAQLAASKYGGNVTIAVRDPETRKMLQLYATGTGQKFPLSATTPQAGSLQEQNGVLSQVATYQNGTPYTFQSSLPVAGGFASGQYPSPPQGSGGATNVTLSLNGQSAADVLEGRVASTVTPGFVQDQYASAQTQSNGRVDNSAMMQQPGLITS
jgi:hypothetical protein